MIDHKIVFICSEHGEQPLYRMLHLGFELSCHCWWQLDNSGRLLWKGKLVEQTKTWRDLQEHDKGKE